MQLKTVGPDNAEVLIAEVCIFFNAAADYTVIQVLYFNRQLKMHSQCSVRKILIYIFLKKL